jgi:hypothetical protein
MNKNVGKHKDYIFVGNTPTGGDLSELEGVKYLVGELAYDLDGKEIDKNYLLPLFVAKESYDKYDRIMMAQLSAIRNGTK